MERVLCPEHSRPCILKTGVSGGSSNGVSFYMCSNTQKRCDFVKVAHHISPVMCPTHGEMVALRIWDNKVPQRVNYLCSKKTSSKCGFFMLDDDTQLEKENSEPNTEPVTGAFNSRVPLTATVIKVKNRQAYDSIKTPAFTHIISDSEVDSTTDSPQQDVSNTSPGSDFSVYTCSSGSDESPPSAHPHAAGIEDPIRQVLNLNTSSGDEMSSCTESPNDAGGGESVEEQSPSQAYFVPEPPTSTTGLSMLSAGDDVSIEIQDESILESTREQSPSSNSSPNTPEASDSEVESTTGSPQQVVYSTSPGSNVSVYTCSSDSDESLPGAHPPGDIEDPIRQAQSINTDDEYTPEASDSEIETSTDSPRPLVSKPPLNTTGLRQDEAVEIEEESGEPTVSLASSCDPSDRLSVDEPTVRLASSCDPSDRLSVDEPTVRLASSCDKLSVDEPTVRLASSCDPSDRLSVDEPTVRLASSCDPSDKLSVDDVEPAPKPKPEPVFKVAHQGRTLLKQYEQVEMMIRTMSDRLPDGGAQLKAHRDAIAKRLEHLNRSVPEVREGEPVLHTAKNKLTSNARMLTSGAVEHLHSSLANCPTVDTLASDPPGLRVDLMIHQRRALAWMLWREQQTPSAGILADDMGLGKTLSMLSLVLTMKSGENNVDRLKRPTEDLVKSSGTLVVCPASLMGQWEGEVRSKIRPGTLRTNVYHGGNRIGFAHELASYDLVITTYNIVGIEAASCTDEEPQPEGASKSKPKKKRTSSHTTLFKVHWKRVILDEAHVIRNHKSGQSIGACKLRSDFRWAVTGTPIQNHLKDFYSLIKFIRLAPFDDFRLWKSTVERKGTLGMQRLNTMVSSLVLRRTKEEMSGELAQLNLTKKIVDTHKITLAEEENQVYQVLFAEARKVMYHWLQEQGENPHLRKAPEVGSGVNGPVGDGAPSVEQTDQPELPPEIAGLIMNVLRPCLVSSAKGRCVLALLLRLRQCCSHLQLLTRVPSKTEQHQDQDELELTLAMGALHLESGAAGSQSPEVQVIPPAFDKNSQSTKIREVVRQLKKIAASDDDDGPPQKSIIVSQWTSMLDIMQHHLDIAGISHTRIDGTVPPAKRNNIVTTFNSPRKNPTVMLLSLQAGGVGLNLIGANHVFMLDMHWNPALEVQAADRCHRVGQKRDVFIHKFVCECTVEERILNLQEKKLSMAKNVLEGASEKSRSSNKLSLNDLKHLFEID